MHRLHRWPETWWQKPLVDFRGRPLPAELAVLALESKGGECGAWINSSGMTTGATDLVTAPVGSKTKYRTVRTKVPSFVTDTTKRIYAAAGLAKGCPDLVLWSPDARTVRFIEVKCPHWDTPTADQERFMDFAKQYGAAGEIVEWEFAE